MVDNSIDEALAGHCDRIDIIIHEDESVSVSDNGRGVPVDIHPEEGVSAAQVIMTVLHAGGKFDDNSYKVSGGLHGVGVSVVNALSKSLRWTSGVKGLTISKLTVMAYQMPIFSKWKPPTRQVPKSAFIPALMYSRVLFWVWYFGQAFTRVVVLNSGVRIILTDERIDKRHEFEHKGGLSEFVSYINAGKDGVNDVFHFISNQDDGISVEVALQWTDTYNEKSFVLPIIFHSAMVEPIYPASAQHWRVV